jgi:hypothetical protein
MAALLTSESMAKLSRAPQPFFQQILVATVLLQCHNDARDAAVVCNQQLVVVLNHKALQGAAAPFLDLDGVLVQLHGRHDALDAAKL